MIAKNKWFLRRAQVISAMVFFSFLIYALTLFHYYRYLPVRVGQKCFHLVVVDRFIAVLIFGFKMSIGFDPYISCMWRNGALDHLSNKVLTRVWIAVFVSVWSVFLFGPTKFMYQLVLITMGVLLIMWSFLYYELWTIQSKENKKTTKRILCGLSEPLNDHEKTTLQSLGFRVTDEMLGFGTCGTTYKCGHANKPENNLALKVIDVTEWVNNKTLSSDFPDEQQRSVEEIRTKYLQVVRKLRGLGAENVVKFLKVHNEAGTFHRIYIITPLAEMNLDTFLTEHKPNGVSEKWARLWFHQLCEGIHYLHDIFEPEPFAHSNIKPENILLYPKYKSKPDPPPIHFGRPETPEENKPGDDLWDQFILKFTDCGFGGFLPLGGKVLTKRNPSVMISPPKRVVGKRHLRILCENVRENEKKFDDIYQMGVILILLLRGDISQLIKEPKDRERIDNEVTGVDAFYVRFDKPEIIEKLVGDKSPELKFLLKRMMEWEPLLRYDIKQVKGSEWMKEAERHSNY